MFGRVGKIVRSKLAFWFPPPAGHEDEGYLFVPEPKKRGAATTQSPPAPAAAEKKQPERISDRTRVLPAHNVLLVGAAGGRELGLALREAGMKVTGEDDMLRAEKLLRRTVFDAVIVDMASNERSLMSLLRILRRSESKRAFFILLADTVGAPEHEIADRIGADAIWPKAGLAKSIVGNMQAVNAERSGRAQ